MFAPESQIAAGERPAGGSLAGGKFAGDAGERKLPGSLRRLMRRILDAMPAGMAMAAERAKRGLLPSEGYRRTRELYRKIGAPERVLGGPFAGMRYAPDAYDSGLLPRLLGTYEWELAPAIDRLLGNSGGDAGGGIDRVVDVGTAEGYYVVGLARRLPAGVRVIGFDSSPRARHMLRTTARLNGLNGRIEIRGACEPDALADALAGAARPLVVCDCEGYELELLDPDRVPALRRAVVVVELHDHLAPAASAAIRGRFAASHRIDATPHRAEGPPLPPAGSPARHGLSDDEWRRATREGRVADQQYFVMTPQ